MKFEINIARAYGKDFTGTKTLYCHYFRIQVPDENKEQVYKQMQQHYPSPEYQLTLSDVRTISTIIWQD